MLKQTKPYNLLGIAGLLLFIISFFVPFQTVDIHAHDTYYVFEMSLALKTAAGMLLSLFTICTFVKKRLYFDSLSWAHAIITLLAIAAGILFLYKAPDAYQPNFSNWSEFQLNNDIIILTIIFFLIAQVLLIINLFMGLRKQRINSKANNNNSA